MGQVAIGGGFWIPEQPYFGEDAFNQPNSSDSLTFDADEEEGQIIGEVVWADGANHTFGTSGSGIGWLAGASITFVATATVRVGIKATVDAANGPVVRCTIGAAAFDVYKDLVGGTDTITSTTWRTDSMASGTPFTLNHGALVGVCWHLDITANAQSVKVRQGSSNQISNTNNTSLVTSGPTYSAQTHRPNVILIADDGTLGTLRGTNVFSAVSANETVGNGNIYGNSITPTAPITVDAIGIPFSAAGSTNFDVGIWLASDPSSPIVSISKDPQQLYSTSSRWGIFPITPTLLDAGTAYVWGAKQNSASAIGIARYDVDATTHWQFNGLDANCCAVKSSGGAAFAAENSSKRRMVGGLRVVKIDDGTGGGGGGSDRRGAMNGGVTQ